MFLPFLKQLLKTKISNRYFLTIISGKYKFIYIETPLVASVTTQFLFVHKPPIDFKAHIVYRKMEELYAKNIRYKSYLKFCIVRNPWSRVVSCYNKKILNADKFASIFFLSQYKGLYPQMSFKDFIKWLCSEHGQDKYADPHWISQHRILYDDTGVPLYDELIKLENINNDFSNLSNKLNMPTLELPHIGLSNSKRLTFKPLYKTWKEYYRNLDYNLLKKINRRYETDAKLFNYPNLTSIIHNNSK